MRGLRRKSKEEGPEEEPEAPVDGPPPEAEDAFGAPTSQVEAASLPREAPLEDTGSWLVEELQPPQEEPEPDALEDWANVPGSELPERSTDTEDEPEEPSAEEGPGEAPTGIEPEAETPPPPEPVGAHEELAEAVEELRAGALEMEQEMERQRELAVKGAALVAERDAELSRIEETIRKQVADEVEGRQGQLAAQSLAMIAEAKAEMSELGLALRDAVEASAGQQREHSDQALDAATAELRAGISETEKRIGNRFVDEVRSHASAVGRERDSLVQALSALSSRMDGLEAQLAKLKREGDNMEAMLATLARYRPSAPPGEAWDSGPLDLNGASFEDLRRVGFSATQATRVLSYREARGGFDSVDRLREVPGLPEKLIARIAPNLTVG